MKTSGSSAPLNETMVWDPLVRIFHWSLVATFIIAWLTADEESRLHELAGYAVVGLVMVRIVWGFIGTRYARFSEFVYRPSTVSAYTRDLWLGKSRRYLGHNPLGGMMVIALLLSLFATGITGLAMENAGEGKGFFASVAAGVPSLVTHAMADDDANKNATEHEGAGEVWEELHEFFANLTLLLVALHIVGVIIGSLVYRENLVRAMFTGKKPG